MMNSELVEQASRKIAERIASQESPVEAAYRLVHLRPPTRRETKRSNEFLARYEDAVNEPDSGERLTRALQALCRVLLSSNEFIYVM